jgi:large subunit ribosomal protein L18
MARTARYRVQLRRRREGKTDYQARKRLVVSKKPRLVVRNTLKNMSAQIVVAKPHGDEVLAAAHSRELKKFGWQASTGNVPSAYLTGLLCGLRAKKEGVKEVVLDIGLIPPTKGSRLFAALNGVLDGDIEVPHGEEKLVKERTNGVHIALYGKKLGPGSEGYAARFSGYLARNLAPEKVPEHFSQVKADIVKSFKSEGKKE